MRTANWTRLLAGIAIGALLGPLALATETGEMRLEKGFQDAATGIRIEEIIVSPTEDLQEVHLSVPNSAGPIEELIVRAKRRTIRQSRPYTFLKDFDHDRYGLVIYLGKHETVPLRLYLNASQEVPPGAAPR